MTTDTSPSGEDMTNETDTTPSEVPEDAEIAEENSAVENEAAGEGESADEDESADEEDTVIEDGFADQSGQNQRILEALLFASDGPLDSDTLNDKLPEGADLGALLASLAERYANRGINIIEVAGGWTFRTAPDLAPHLTVYRTVRRRLSRAALETLAIIAYHQPVTRAEIEDIRGVGLSRGTLDQLLEAEWIKPKGRRPVPGRPLTWGTTAEFLNHFGIENLTDLPGVEELKASGLLQANPVAIGGADELPLDDPLGESLGEGDESEDDSLDEEADPFAEAEPVSGEEGRVDDGGVDGGVSGDAEDADGDDIGNEVDGAVEVEAEEDAEAAAEESRAEDAGDPDEADDFQTE